MNDNSLKLPKFKYHPNVYDKEKVLDAVQFDNNVLQWRSGLYLHGMCGKW